MTDSTPQVPAPRQVKWYSKSNRIGGYVSMATMLAVGIPSAVVGSATSDSGFHPLDLGLPLLGYLPLVLFSRPEVIAGPRYLLLRGPLIERLIPWGTITGLESEGKYLVVVAGKERYRAIGVEAMNYSLMFHRRSSVRSLHGQIDEYRASYARDAVGPVRIRLVRPPLYELLLFPAWTAILLAIWFG